MQQKFTCKNDFKCTDCFDSSNFGCSGNCNIDYFNYEYLRYTAVW